MISYGATRTIDGGTISMTGYPRAVEAVEACYRVAIMSGWWPQPLRVYWWQFWRPKEYEEGLKFAMEQELLRIELGKEE